MLDLYTLEIDTDNQGMDYMALVDSPAHMKSWISFSKDEKPSIIKDHFNDEKRIVTGVAIAVGLPIYRNSPDIGEHYVVFTKDNTRQIWEQMMKAQYMHNVNEMHESNKDVKDIFLFESYFIDRKRGVNPPNEFKDQNLQDGSVIVSYKVDDDEAWAKIKNGTYSGFSIEGWFKRVKTKIKNKMSKENTFKSKFRDLYKTLFPEKFGEAVTADGVTLKWDGELAEGIAIMMVSTTEGGEPEEVLALEGDYIVTIDEEVITLTVGADGILTTITRAEPDPETPPSDTSAATEEEMKAVLKKMTEVAELIKTQKAEFKTQSEKTRSDFEAKLKAETEARLKIETNFKEFVEVVKNEFDADDKKKFVRKEGAKTYKDFIN